MRKFKNNKKVCGVCIKCFFFALDRKGAFSLPALHNWLGSTSHGILIISDMGLKLLSLFFFLKQSTFNVKLFMEKKEQIQVFLK